MAKKQLLLPASFLAVGLLVGACSTESDGTSVAVSSSVAPEPSVDLALLDPGDNPTEPAAPYGTATTETILDVEGQRLAEFVTLPFEVDPELTDVKMPTMVIRSAKNLEVVLSPGVGTGPANGKMLYGYVSTAATPVATAKDDQYSLVQMVLRYTDPAAAAAGAREMHNNLVNNPDAALKETVQKVNNLPDTLISSGAPGDEVSVNAFTPHGDYVLYTWASAPAAEKDWTTKAVAKALELQAPLIDKFPATPTTEQNGGKSAMPEMDQNDILIYAIPEEDANAGLGNDMAVYGPRGMAHRSTNPPLTYNTLTDAGAMHNAAYKTIVYRASTPQGAQDITDAFIDDLVKADGYAAAPPPPGLPNASCVSKDTTQGTQYYCYVTNGRYVGEASSVDDKTEVDQLISAQYLIFEKADQDAE